MALCARAAVPQPSPSLHTPCDMPAPKPAHCLQEGPTRILLKLNETPFVPALLLLAAAQCYYGWATLPDDALVGVTDGSLGQCTSGQTKTRGRR